MTRRDQHRKNRRIRGLCRVDGCPEYTGDAYRCSRHEAEHLKSAARWQRARRKRLKTASAAPAGA